MTTALIALGGNLGDPATTFVTACTQLEQHPQVRVVARSSLLSTTPVGELAGERFLNSAARLEVGCSPLELLDLLQQTETALGRVRTVHWGPRILDLDLIGFGNQQFEHPRLIVPHPHCWYRRFVLDPLAEVAADWRHPQFRLTVRDLIQRLELRPLPVRVDAGGQSSSLCSQLRQRFPNQVSCSPDELYPAVTLTTEPNPAANFTIALAPGTEIETATQCLRAALDEPHQFDVNGQAISLRDAASDGDPHH